MRKALIWVLDLLVLLVSGDMRAMAVRKLIQWKFAIQNTHDLATQDRVSRYERPTLPGRRRR